MSVTARMNRIQGRLVATAAIGMARTICRRCVWNSSANVAVWNQESLFVRKLHGMNQQCVRAGRFRFSCSCKRSLSRQSGHASPSQSWVFQLRRHVYAGFCHSRHRCHARLRHTYKAHDSCTIAPPSTSQVVRVHRRVGSIEERHRLTGTSSSS